MNSPTSQIDIRRYLRILWRWKLVFLAVVIVVPALAYFLSARNPKVYESSVLMQVSGEPVDTSLFANTAVGARPAPAGSEINVAARLIQTTGVAQEAARHLTNPPANPRSLLGSINVSADSNTGFLTITASSSGPQRAAQIATAFADAVVVQRGQEATNRVGQAINQLRAQVQRVRDPVEHRQLSDQLQRFRALQAAQGGNATIIEPAIVPTSAVSPNPGQAARLSLIIALLLGLAAVALAQTLDRRTREPHDVEELTGLPLLSAIPRSAFPGQGRSHMVDEAFYTLRASLSYFNIDRVIKTVLVTSPAQGDGKTTVAVNLARAMARAGLNVIIVDADLRRPQVHQRLEVAPSAGLGGVLVGTARLQDVLIDSKVEGASTGRLRVLPAGPPPPNPSELTGSLAMRDTLQALGEMSDIVLIDSTPVLVVSDAIPLMDRVSGLLVVCRLNHTSKDAMRRLRHMTEGGKGMALGVVATGSVAGGMYGYGYGYGYRYGYGYAPSNGSGNGAESSERNGSGRRRLRIGRRTARAPTAPTGSPNPEASESSSPGQADS
ncbi:MAG: polysaccharide biosynthesis tyrosine autokinase [Actinobacteria bacterium]|nr:MAG: polysaccharide biosynthesis tyrosine autokinase [Actinomycetota bacterium]